MKLGSETGSLVNHIYSTQSPVTPVVGMGATILLWSDRQACTIRKISGKSLWVSEDIATRTDKNGMSDCQSYSYQTTNALENTWKEFVLNKNGKWVQKDSTSTSLLIGKRDQHYDFSF